MDQEEVHSFIGHEEIRRFFDGFADKSYFVGHNAISFDGPLLHRLEGVLLLLLISVDTLVLSYLYDPGLIGGHSLEAWGHRLKDPKGDFHDWSGYSQEMDTYCQQDVRLGKKGCTSTCGNECYAWASVNSRAKLNIRSER
jgi:DNA polymerase-1